MTVERTPQELKKILDRVSLKYLGRLTDVPIKWGRYRKPKRPRKNINLGLYYFEGGGRIEVHAVLRQRWVPTYYVESVVYHELLHHVMSPELKKYSRRAPKSEAPNYHPEIFLLAEKLFKKYAKAIEWENENLSRLLSS
jgi:hypothetical protein